MSGQRSRFRVRIMSSIYETEQSRQITSRPTYSHTCIFEYPKSP